jgi:perosamine synthetase
VAARYSELVAGLDGVTALKADDADHRRSWFVYVVELAEGLDRERVMASLRADGVATAEYVPCVHLQPYLREQFGFAPGMCPVAESAAGRTLALPFHTRLGADDQEHVVEALARALR